MAEEITTIRVPGTNFDIQLNSVYQIIEKTDLRGAPSGYKELGITKVPDYNITTTVFPRFDAIKNIWDTGLDETSSCFTDMEPKQKNAELKILNTYLVNPLLKIKPKGFLDPLPRTKSEIIGDKEYIGLENHKIELGIDRFFNTANAEELFNLFTAIYTRDLCPKEEEMNPAYIQADFCVVNDKQKVNKTEEREYKKDKATAKLIGLLEKDKKFTFELLKYCGIQAGEESSEKTLVSFFRRWLEDKKDRSGENAEYFLNRVENFSDDRGRDELYLYTQMASMFNKNEIQKRNGEFFLGSTSLGNSLKTYAELASKDEKLKEEILGKSLVG